MTFFRLGDERSDDARSVAVDEELVGRGKEISLGARSRQAELAVELRIVSGHSKFALRRHLVLFEPPCDLHVIPTFGHRHAHARSPGASPEALSELARREVVAK